jgi:hypothetical protein
MNVSRNLVLSILFISSLAQAYAESLDEFLGGYQTFSAEERIEKLAKAIETSPDKNKEVLRMLLSDAQYEVAKRKIASQMLSLSELRAANLPNDDYKSFSRQAIRYDALAILQSVPLGWLTTTERKRALSLFIQLENETRIADITSNDNKLSLKTDNKSETSVDDVIAMLNDALKQMAGEDLSVIEKITPNGSIREALVKCEGARETLMAQSPDLSGLSRVRWEAAMLHLSKAVSVLKQRQTLKYALWAEGRYRESNSTNESRQPSDEKTIKLYKFLSEINVSLVTEPSLAREITKRLYELYDRMDSQKSKEFVRYESIRSLDKRKTLDDF